LSSAVVGRDFGPRTKVFKTRFVEAVQRDSTCPVPSQKIFRFAADPNQIHNSRHPVPTEGRFAIVTDVGRDAVDAGGAADESANLRTAKSCGPDAPTLAFKSAGFSADDGDNKARSPGRARRKPLKPLRGECRVISGVTVVTNARAFYTTRAAAGAPGARHSLRPLMSEGETARTTRAQSVARSRECECCLKFESANAPRRPCERRDP
jgi:hypothetical protein